MVSAPPTPMNSAPHFHLSATAAAGEGLDSDEGLPPRCKRLKLTHAADEVVAPFPFPTASDEINIKPPLYPPPPSPRVEVAAPFPFFPAASDAINIEPPLYPPPPSPPQHCYVCYETFTSSEALHRHMRRHHPSPTWPGEEVHPSADSLLHLSWAQTKARRFIFSPWQELDGNSASHKGQEDMECGPKHN